MNSEGQISEEGVLGALNAQHRILSGLTQTERKIANSRGPTSAAHEVSPESLPIAVQTALAKSRLEESITRQIGDSSVYKYYLKSAGVKSLMIYLVALAIYAFCDGFPCKFSAGCIEWPPTDVSL